MEGRPPMVATAKTTARQLHLVRAAQSAGEAFACPLTDDDAPGRWLSGTSLVWLAAGVAAAAGLILAF
jgi:hypothetical protein